jgi:magnesium transporter
MPQTDTLDRLDDALQSDDLIEASNALTPLAPPDIAILLERLPAQDRAVAYRLLTKDRALEVFERLDTAAQGELIELLAEEDVARVFDSLDPDDQVELLDELPAKVTKRLMRQLTPGQRAATAVIFGYEQGSIGRRMSPDYVHVRADEPILSALQRVRERGADAETIYTLPVLNQARVLVGVVSLRDLLLADSDPVGEHMTAPMYAYANEPAEEAARRCVDRQVLAIPIVDREQRLVGILTVDDANRIVQAAEEEDAARAGAAEPLRRPYLLTPVRSITRSRIVWLLVLAISAILTVKVLDLFQATLEQEVALALFIPLLTGTGGNTGSQAATTVTRALATGDARPRDVGKVAFKEVRTGLLLGTVLGALGFVVASLVFSVSIGIVIALTLVAVCTLAATVGGTMPLIAKALRVDPAVFSTPFISTFCDATGLIIYFSIAKTVLGL